MDINKLRIASMILNAAAVVLVVVSLITERYLLIGAFACLVISTPLNYIMLKKRREMIMRLRREQEKGTDNDEEEQ